MKREIIGTLKGEALDIVVFSCLWQLCCLLIFSDQKSLLKIPKYQLVFAPSHIVMVCFVWFLVVQRNFPIWLVKKKKKYHCLYVGRYLSLQLFLSVIIQRDRISSIPYGFTSVWNLSYRVLFLMEDILFPFSTLILLLHS